MDTSTSKDNITVVASRYKKVHKLLLIIII